MDTHHQRAMSLRFTGRIALMVLIVIFVTPKTKPQSPTARFISYRLRSVLVRNYRSLADIEIARQPINILFGPNGAGKSSFLDTIWFVRDCEIRGVDLASTVRSHGIGLLYDGAVEDEAIEIALTTSLAEYALKFVLSSGQIEPYKEPRCRALMP